MIMDMEDAPLLHFPDLVLAVLRAGRDGPATLADAARLLSRDRDLAHEDARIDPDEMSAHLDRARRHLWAAQAIEMLDGLRFRTTPRGVALLRAHPAGVDDGVLMDYPEFRAWLQALQHLAPPEDPRPREFLDGWTASQRGCALEDNPFAAETAQHDSWEDGWLENDRRTRE